MAIFSPACRLVKPRLRRAKLNFLIRENYTSTKMNSFLYSHRDEGMI
jgi:hypothetical protein